MILWVFMLPQQLAIRLSSKAWMVQLLLCLKCWGGGGCVLFSENQGGAHIEDVKRDRLVGQAGGTGWWYNECLLDFPAAIFSKVSSGGDWLLAITKPVLCSQPMYTTKWVMNSAGCIFTREKQAGIAIVWTDQEIIRGSTDTFGNTELPTHVHQSQSVSFPPTPLVDHLSPKTQI